MKKIRILVIRNITVEPFITKLSEFLKKKILNSNFIPAIMMTMSLFF